jgi:hypothetical protein
MKEKCSSSILFSDLKAIKLHEHQIAGASNCKIQFVSLGRAHSPIELRGCDARKKYVTQREWLRLLDFRYTSW